MTNKEKFLKLVSSEATETLAKAQERTKNRAFIRHSQEIAMAILDRLDQINWTQKQLADAMGVTPQQVNKWVRGSENFTLETLANLEHALQFSLITVYLPEPLKTPATEITSIAQES